MGSRRKGASLHVVPTALRWTPLNLYAFALTRAVFGAPRPKRITEKIELDGVILFVPVPVFAVDHVGLIGMKLQTTRLEPLRNLLLHRARMALRATMDQPVIGKPTNRERRIVSRHPTVEGIVQEQVRQ